MPLRPIGADETKSRVSVGSKVCPSVIAVYSSWATHPLRGINQLSQLQRRGPHGTILTRDVGLALS